MTQAKFFRHRNVWNGFLVQDHAGFDDYGRDIVCASVTSAVQLTANGITEVLKVQAELKVSEASIGLTLKEESSEAEAFIEALHLHLCLLQNQFPENIKISDLEV